MSRSPQVLIESEISLHKTQLINTAKDYYKQRYAEDVMASYYIPNQFVKGIFNILLKLSYWLCGIGIALTFQSQAINQQKIILYLQYDGKKTFIVILIILGAIILAIIKAIKEDTHITPRTKKNLNFFVDIARISFYILVLIFIKPFVDENREKVLLASFWVYLASTVIFILRKTVKWAYYMFSANGRKILSPWQSKNPTDIQKLTQFADFFQFILNKKYRNALKQPQEPSEMMNLKP